MLSFLALAYMAFGRGGGGGGVTGGGKGSQWVESMGKEPMDAESF